MNKRDAFEQGFARGLYLKDLKYRLIDAALTDDERESIKKEIEFVNQEVMEYQIGLGGTTKETDGLTIRSLVSHNKTMADMQEIA